MLIALIFLALFGQARADPMLPDSMITPGAVATTQREEMCAAGYARAHRVWRHRAQTMMRYGIPRAQWSQYADDDLVPVCAGGDNASPLNHWAQPIGESFEKNDLERYACRAICEGGEDPVGWQHDFMTNWPMLYEEVYGSPP